MNEIIASILDAEQKAEEIVAKAASDCRRISLEGAERAAKVKEDAIALLAAEREQSEKTPNAGRRPAYDSPCRGRPARRRQALKNRSRAQVKPAADAVLRRLFG